MNNYLSIEFGRKSILNNEIIVEFAKSRYPVQDVKDIETGNVILLDRKSPGYQIPAKPNDISLKIYINGFLAATGKPFKINNNRGTVITEIIDEKSVSTALVNDNTIELDKEHSVKIPFICDVSINGNIIARGEIVVESDDGEYCIMISEVLYN